MYSLTVANEFVCRTLSGSVPVCVMITSGSLEELPLDLYESVCMSHSLPQGVAMDGKLHACYCPLKRIPCQATKSYVVSGGVVTLQLNSL